MQDSSWKKRVLLTLSTVSTLVAAFFFGGIVFAGHYEIINYGRGSIFVIFVLGVFVSLLLLFLSSLLQSAFMYVRVAANAAKEYRSGD
jgi:hypothetical protein